MDLRVPDACGDKITEATVVNPEKVIPLDILVQNQEAIVVRINAGQNALTRLCHLGLTPGVLVKKIASAPFFGPIEIRVRDTLLAIGRGLARKVLVIPRTDANEGRA